MYKLMIVDDEDWIRIGLTISIQWQEYGIDTLVTAHDGKEALEFIENCVPDIIITDIRMPYMDGLEMIEVLRKKYPGIKIIIISGYSDFAYAQQAVKLGAVGYILKPIEEKLLIDLCIECIRQISEERVIKEEQIRMKEQLTESLPILKERFLNQWANGYITDSHSIKEKLDLLEIEFQGPWFRVIVYHIDGLESKSADYLEKEKQYVMLKAYEIITQILTGLKNGIVFFGSDNSIIAILSFHPLEEYTSNQDIISICNRINDCCKKEVGHSLTIGVGNSYCGYDNVHLSGREAKNAVAHMFYLGKDRVITSEDFQDLENNWYQFDIENFVTLGNLLKIMDYKGVFTFLEKIHDEITSWRGSIAVDYVRLIYRQLANIILSAAFETRPEFRNHLKDALNQINRLDLIENIFEMHSWLDKFLKDVFERVQYKNESKVKKSVELALKYISEHLNEDIALNIIAEHLYINPSYLCKIFSEQMGEPLTKYIMRMRIEKSKYLLKDMRFKIYEVGEQVGYPNTRYFTRIFKEIVGITPLDFRQKAD